MERAYVYGSWIWRQSKFKGERFIYNLTSISQPYIVLVSTIVFEEFLVRKTPALFCPEWADVDGIVEFLPDKLHLFFLR